MIQGIVINTPGFTFCKKTFGGCVNSCKKQYQPKKRTPNVGLDTVFKTQKTNKYNT